MDVTDFNSLMVGISLVAVSLAVIAFLIGFFYFGIGMSRRISSLERGQDAFQSKIAESIAEAMKSIPIPENPGEEMAERRGLLLAKLGANEITRAEGVELNEILLVEKQAAQQRGDTATLVAIILGLALLAAILERKKR